MAMYIWILIAHLQVAPKGLAYVQTMGCGACSNEHAYKAAFMAYRVGIGMQCVFVLRMQTLFGDRPQC